MLFRSDRKSTRLNSSHTIISYAVFCLKKKNRTPALAVLHHRPVADRLDALRPHAPRVGGAGASATTVVQTRRHGGRTGFFFFNDRPPPDIYTLPLPPALPV